MAHALRASEIASFGLAIRFNHASFSRSRWGMFFENVRNADRRMTPMANAHSRVRPVSTAISSSARPTMFSTFDRLSAP